MELPSVGTFQAEVSGPAWGAKTAPILGVAGPAVVTAAELGAAGSPVSRLARCKRRGARLAGQPAPPPTHSRPPASLEPSPRRWDTKALSNIRLTNADLQTHVPGRPLNVCAWPSKATQNNVAEPDGKSFPNHTHRTALDYEVSIHTI